MRQGAAGLRTEGRLGGEQRPKLLGEGRADAGLLVLEVEEGVLPSGAESPDGLRPLLEVFLR
jgi:hypothetical protein